MAAPPAQAMPPRACSPPMAAPPAGRSSAVSSSRALEVSLGEQRAIPLGDASDPVAPYRSPELSVPPVEIHPEDPDDAPAVSGEIHGSKEISHKPDSLLLVSFGEQREPSIQIDSAYQEDADRIAAPYLSTHFDEETPPMRRLDQPYLELLTPSAKEPAPLAPPRHQEPYGVEPGRVGPDQPELEPREQGEE
ncbi:MAG: hypothetical protein RBU30_09480, partial [Polyangia bacterium]|nr:hypothetical protein [Polyangia bacterium]